MKGPARFLESVAMPLVDELRSIEALKTFTTNPDVIGAHAEAAVRKFVARVVHPLRVCTGSVISEELCATPRTVPQLDSIIWMPLPACSI